MDTALKKEKEKYEKCPVIPDRVPGHEAAQGWGYVVTGYFLAEQSFKSLLYVREEKVLPLHSLYALFNMFDPNDKMILREYYDDFRATIGGKIGAFPFNSLDKFLSNLDGDENARGNKIGSLDWRYFLSQEKISQEMPLVSVDYLHEVVFGCTRIVEHANTGSSEPSRYTRSWRMQRQRARKYSDWLTVRMNSEGWDELGDRLEILWGPDYQGRYDLYIFRGKGAKVYFSEFPQSCDLSIVDKRKEIDAFDAEEGFRSIGVIRKSHPTKY